MEGQREVDLGLARRNLSRGSCWLPSLRVCLCAQASSVTRSSPATPSRRPHPHSVSQAVASWPWPPVKPQARVVYVDLCSPRAIAIEIARATAAHSRELMVLSTAVEANPRTWSAGACTLATSEQAALVHQAVTEVYCRWRYCCSRMQSHNLC